MGQVSFNAADGRLTGDGGRDGVHQLLHIAAGVHSVIVKGRAIGHHAMEHRLFPSVGDGRLFKLHHAHRTPVLGADGVGSVVQNRRITGNFEPQCRHVVVFHVRVAAVQFGLYAGDIAGCAHRRPQ